MRLGKFLVSLTISLAFLHFTAVILLAETDVLDNSSDSTDQTETSKENNIDQNDGKTISNQKDSDTDQLIGEKNEIVDTDSSNDKSNQSDRVNSEEDKLNMLSVKEEFQEGDSHKKIAEYKEKLNHIGFEVDTTNEFDSTLVHIIKEFQEYYGIDITGNLNEGTMAKIDEIYNSPLQNGKRHKDTIQLKKDLTLIGMPVPGSGTNLFGKQTEQKVKEFQRKYNLKVNGIADPVTLAKLDELVTAPLSNGMRHEDVITLKQNLGTLGFKVPGSGTNLFGKQTEQKVKEFQKYYGLKQTGIADKETLNKIDAILKSPLQNGKRHADTIELKKDLALIGMPVPGSGTNLFGRQTEQKVKEFQRKYNLAVNGIADPVTLAKLNELVTAPLSNGMRREDVKTLKQNLGTLGFKVPGNGTNLFGKQTEQKVKEFQKYFGIKQTGIADKETLNRMDEILKSPLQNGKRHADTIKLKKDLALIGMPVPGSGTNLFGKQTEQKVKEFQRKYNLIVNGIADPVTLAKLNELVTAPLSNGMRREDVKTLKQNLGTLGFKVPGSGTDLFGKQTEQKVKEFQKYFGLKQTGIADKDTISKIEGILKSPLQNGKRHADTIKLKEDLHKLGFTVPGNGTELYGKQTENQVRAFQKYYGLINNGIADEVTLAKIQEVLNSPLQFGKHHDDTVKLKEDLRRLGFPVPGNGNNYYGKETTEQVKAFQSHYNLTVSGIADEITLKKIESILNSPLQNGKRHSDTVKLKEDLAKIGYRVPGNGTNYYGVSTEEKIKELQKDHNLPISGIADEITLAKIKELLKNPVERTSQTDYKLTLNEAINIQLNRPIITTDKYRNSPAYASTRYLKLLSPARISGSVVNIRTSPNMGNNVAFQFAGGSPITINKVVTGASYSGSTSWYEIAYDSKRYYVHSSLVSGVQAEVTGTVNVRAGKGSSHHIYGQLNKGDKVTIINPGTSWHEISYSTWRKPKEADLREYLDPSKVDKFQHLRLDSSVNVSASELNKALSGKGILAGKGQAFINGAQKHGINEAYLIAHAFLETGHGTSPLANGIKVGKDKNGKLVRVTSSNEKNLTSIKTTYNMFGIGAVDSCPVNCGAITAYENRWFTPEAAIEGGAAWIGNGYIYNEHSQNTLYKMKWNPRMSEGYAWKQYATDIAWAEKQTERIKEIYNQLENPSYHFDIPKYN